MPGAGSLADWGFPSWWDIGGAAPRWVPGTCWGGKNQLGLCSSVLRKEGSTSVAVLSHVRALKHESQVGKVLSLSCRDLERGWAAGQPVERSQAPLASP